MTDARPSPEPNGPRPDGLGALLREARARAGLDLADVASRTHVRRAYLEALEADDADALPEDVYARNFVRLYARAVGADVDEALERFGRLRPPVDPYATGERAADGRAVAEAPKGRRAPESGRRDAAPTDPTPHGAPPSEDDGPPRAVRETPPPDFRPKRSVSATPRVRAPGGRAAIDAGRRRPRGRAIPGAVLLRQAAPLLLTLALAGVLVGATVWGFNRLLFSGRTDAGTPEPDPAATGPEVAGEAGGAAPAPIVGGDVVADEIVLSVTTDPPGAEVTVDAFPLPGVTPIAGVPVSARDERTVRIARDGYEPFEAAFDMTDDRDIVVTLEPLADAAATEPAAPGAGVVVEVNEATWLEAYQSPNRNEGERLVYTTAQPGERFEFQRPVYLHFGNAPGVDLFVDGEALTTVGDGGAVTGQSFPAQ